MWASSERGLYILFVLLSCGWCCLVFGGCVFNSNALFCLLTFDFQVCCTHDKCNGGELQ